MSALMTDDIQVSLVYAHIDGTWFERVFSVPRGATIEQGIRTSGILDDFPDWSVDTLAVGVFSVRLPLDAILHDLDRIEIYRALLIDPKDRRVNKVNSTRNAGKWRRVIKK